MYDRRSMSPTTSLPTFSIRPAMIADVRACRMLLPTTAAEPEPPRYFAAVSTETDRIVGAAGMSLNTDSNVRVGRVDVHVIPTFRRHGIGRSLLSATLDAARIERIEAVDSWNWVLPGSDDEQVWQRFGFQQFKSIYEFEAEIMAVYRSTLPLLERLKDRGRIPPDAKLVPLSEAPHDEVISLQAEHLGGSLTALAPLVTGQSLNSFHRDLSLVLLVGGKVVGAALASRTGDPEVFIQSSLIVHPTLRKSYAMLWIINEQARRADRSNVKRFRFTTFKLENGARLVGPAVPLTIVKTQLWMRRSLCASPASDDAS